LWILSAAFLLTCGTVAPAQASLGGFVGVSHPMGDFGDATNTGYHIGGLYSMPLLPTISAGLRGAYNHFGWDAEDTDGSFNSLELLAFGKISVPAGPFGMIGFGFSSSKIDLDTNPTDIDTDRDTDFTYAIGGGYNLMMLKITVLYHSISTEGDASNYLTLSAGIEF
jgi:hypothetical protein